MPPGVDGNRYGGPKDSSGEPLVLCTAASDDPRKRVDVLVAAFGLLVRERPDARLVLAPPAAALAARLLDSLDREARVRAEVRAISDSDELAALYRSAAVTVLPSVDEAFGLVLVESLAAGTPVVGSDHGAIPEVVDDPSIGRLFSPGDPAALCRELLEVLDLARDPATPSHCRASAYRWDWAAIGPRHEEVYAALIA